MGVNLSHAERGGKNGFAHWWPSWKVCWSGGAYKVNFDLHRAGGLWPWAMLLVLAWSSVAFNLTEVYNPVMRGVFAHQPTEESIPKLARPQPEPDIGWEKAREIGRRLLQTEVQAKGFTVLEEQALSYDPHKALYRYRVKSDRDIREHEGSTSIWFDAHNGEQRAAYLPTGEASGDTAGNWLFALHMAALWGLPFKVFICALGLAVAMLSVTGVVIWWRKRASRVKLSAGSQAPAWEPKSRKI
jgi:uncharacterized iron-regulated membrane protein